MKITFIIGTRPELIKVAPVILECQRQKIEIDIVNTAQHKDLLDPYWKTFNIWPSKVLDVMIPGQTLTSLTSRALIGIEEYLNSVEIKPSVILAQGDTTTVMAASIVSFFNGIKFAHLEAGLRSFDMLNPFPEELNRKIASISANIHFCPTEVSRENLLKEGISSDLIHVVGNTVIDSLDLIKNSEKFQSTNWSNENLFKINDYKRSVLITCHRRENHGDNLLKILNAISKLAKKEQDTIFVWALHPNPNVREKVLDSELANLDNLLLTNPLDYLDLLKMIDKSCCIISDSGGIQEEAPSFETPVLILRKATERPEGVDVGVAFLVGTDEEEIFNKFEFIKKNNVKFGQNPYGNGDSSKKIVKQLYKLK